MADHNEEVSWTEVTPSENSVHLSCSKSHHSFSFCSGSSDTGSSGKSQTMEFPWLAVTAGISDSEKYDPLGFHIMLVI